MQLAQLNIGKFKAGRDDPSMAYFFDNLDRVNALAERMPGFVWRLKDDSGNATRYSPGPGDPSFAVNMTRVGKRRSAGELRVEDRFTPRSMSARPSFSKKPTARIFVHVVGR